jgi:chromosome segregation ATPase
VRQRLDREAAEQRAQEDDRARREREHVAAAAAAEIEVAEQEITELHEQRHRAEESLRRLTDQIGGALDTLAGCLRDDPPVDPPNVVATLPVRGQAVSGAVADR